MAIIYTYPVKASPAADDLILISDSADSNKTKQVKISTLPGGSGSGVSSVTAVLPLASTGGGTPAISLTGLTGFGAAGQVIKVNSGADGLEWGAAGGSTLPGGADTQVQFNSGGTAFGGDANLTFTGTPNPDTLTLAHKLDIKGDGTSNAGKLKLYCQDNTTPHYVELIGPAHSGSPVSYSITLPNKIATQSAVSGGRVLEVNASGVGNWITTPTGGSGISFSGNTVSGIATFASTSSATVNPEVKLLANGQMTFDGSGGNVGIKYDVGSTTLRVGDVGGNSESLALYSDGAAKITVSDSDVTVVDTTQFNSGLKFGSAGSTLSRYEEGTWTPAPWVYSGTAPTVTSANGTYTIIGDICHITFQIVVTGSSGSNAAMILDGVPTVAQGDATNGEQSAGQLFVNTDSNTYNEIPSMFYISGDKLTMVVQGGSKNSLTSPYGLKAQDVVPNWFRPSGGSGITLKGSATYKLL